MLPSSLNLTNTANDTTGPSLRFGKVRSTSIVQNGDTLGSIAFCGHDGTSLNIPGAYVLAEVDGTPGSNDLPTRLVFSTCADGSASPTERMRITQAGNVLIGSTSYDYPLAVTNSSTTQRVGYFRAGSSSYGGGVLFIDTPTAASTSFNLIEGYAGASAIQFIVRGNGNVLNTNNSYTAISDIKLKENIVDANSQWADIKALRVRNYNLKEGQTHRQIGLIAQEVEPVCPALVGESPDRDAEGNDLGTTTKSVNYSVLYMKAVKALQEAMERIEQLEASNADLLARVTALEGA